MKKTGLQPLSRPVEQVYYLRGWGWVHGNTSGANRQKTNKQTRLALPLALLETQLFEHVREHYEGFRNLIGSNMKAC